MNVDNEFLENIVLLLPCEKKKKTLETFSFPIWPHARTHKLMIEAHVPH